MELIGKLCLLKKKSHTHRIRRWMDLRTRMGAVEKRIPELARIEPRTYSLWAVISLN
jgi:hypothetical protein